MEVALILADGVKERPADPAIEATCMPIFFWARAVWHGWLPTATSRSTLKDSQRRMTNAKRPWAVVRGPSAAMAATAAQIGWQVASPTVLVTDEGRRLLLFADPPIVILNGAKRATRKWRLRNVQQSVWWLGDPHTHEVVLGPTMEVAFGHGRGNMECAAYRGGTQVCDRRRAMDAGPMLGVRVGQTRSMQVMLLQPQ